MRERHFRAVVTHQSARPNEEDRFAAITKATTETEAARYVAELAASRRFGEAGEATYLVETKDGFRAFIGVPKKRLHNGMRVTSGTTIIIQLTAV